MQMREIVLLCAVVVGALLIFYSLPTIASLRRQGKITNGRSNFLIFLTITVPLIGLIMTHIASRNAKAIS